MEAVRGGYMYGLFLIITSEFSIKNWAETSIIPLHSNRAIV
jgi:hypothetical protein